MSRTVICFLVALLLPLVSRAQTLTEAEVTDKMYEAFALNKAKNTAEALDAFLLVGENTRLQRSEAEREVYVCSQTMACSCYRKLARYHEGYQLAKALLQGNITEAERKDIEYEYAYSGYMYAADFIKRRSTSQQREYGRGILEEIAPLANDMLKRYILPKIPLSWFFEATALFERGNYPDALVAFQKAQRGYHDLGKDRDEMAILYHIAFTQQLLNRYPEAYGTYLHCLELAEKVQDTGKQMEVLKELFKMKNAGGNVELAHAYDLRMDSLMNACADLQARHSYCNHKGDVAKANGQMALAEQWYLRGKDIAESTDTASMQSCKSISYTCLRDLYAACARYDEALVYGLKCVEGVHTQGKPEELSYDMPYMALADIYCKKGDRENCHACLERLFAHEAQMTEPKELHRMYVTRARCLFAFGDYRHALADYLKADELLASRYAQEDGDRINLLALIGGTCHRLGDYAQSEQYYRKYAVCTRALYGENSVEHITARIFLANAEGFAGHTQQGCQEYAQAQQQLRTLIGQRISSMSDTDRAGLWTPLSSLLTLMTPYALEAGQRQASFTRQCYDALVLSKAFLLASERSTYDVLKQKGTPQELQDYALLTGMRSRISAWQRDSKANADSILALSQKAGVLEKRLAACCKKYGYGTDFLGIDYDTVRQAMGQDEVLIDFTDYLSQSQGRRYAAYIINKVQDNPRLIPLFAEREMDSLGIVRPDMYYGQDYAQEVLRLLWEPLSREVAEGATIYYVPSQMLFQVSLESLPLADGTLLGNHYHFVRLSSARELLRMRSQHSNGQANTTVLYGGLQYDLDAASMARESLKYPLPDFLTLRGSLVRGDTVFRELRGSLEEVMRIESTLKHNKWSVTTRTGKDGTMESFLSMHGQSPRLLHIATHGFYYTPAQAKSVEYLRGYTDAMSLSGLVLSGGNAAWLGKPLPQGVLGGILTANDIARMDLSGTDLVVLSACQTGQGKATPEGLYGLQRAFKKAGVGTMVMSLWNVSDRTSSEFMATFYEQLARKSCAWDKRKAFEETRNIIRKRHPDPFHWAAFVMQD